MTKLEFILSLNDKLSDLPRDVRSAVCWAAVRLLLAVTFPRVWL